MVASGSGLWMACSKRRGSLSAAWVACTCETASPAALVEATGDPGMSCSDRPADSRPDGGEGSQAANGAAAVPGGHGGDVNRCRGDGADEQDETEPDRDEHDVGERGADGVAYHAHGRADADPVVHRVERPVELLVERHVEDLVEGEQAEQEPGDRGHDPSRPGRQHQRDSHQDQRFHRDADKSAEAELPDTVGRHEIEPHEHERKHGDGDPHRPAGARAGAGAVQPDHVAAERLGQQQQRDGDRDHPDQAAGHVRMRPR